MKISKSLQNQKRDLLDYFRKGADAKLVSLSQNYKTSEYKKKATEINHYVIAQRDNLISQIDSLSKSEHWDTNTILNCILMVYYTSDVVMLEKRNEIWKYDYMAFSRRIGELWEPFCKLCFSYPIKSLSLYTPPVFSDVKAKQTKKFADIVTNLNLTATEKRALLDNYNSLWSIITSGEIDLTSDLHFTDGTYKYVVDFKSGFGSNEKGNTNRLLMVGEVYKILSSDYKCMIFVRSNDNNHYLQTLQNSGIWDTFTGSDTYDKIYNFTGFDIETWITKHIDWINDFTPSMSSHIKANKLEKYLIW